MQKKYKLSNSTKQINGHTLLYRIEALEEFGDIKKGELGGWVESEDNLSHYDTCWIKDNAAVFGKAKVEDDAIVKDNAVVYGNVDIIDNAEVSGNARVIGSQYSENLYIQKNAIINGDAVVSVTYGYIGENTRITDNAAVTGDNIKINNSIIDETGKVEGRLVTLNNSSVNVKGTLIGDIVVSVGDLFISKCSEMETKTKEHTWVQGKLNISENSSVKLFYDRSKQIGSVGKEINITNGAKVINSDIFGNLSVSGEATKLHGIKISNPSGDIVEIERTPIVISGTPWLTTLTDSHMVFDCRVVKKEVVKKGWKVVKSLIEESTEIKDKKSVKLLYRLAKAYYEEEDNENS